MPKEGKRGKKRQGLLSSSDVTLHDFADARLPQACSRLKKSVISATGVGAISKTGSVQKLVEKEDEALNWFEKDLEDFVIEDVPEEDVEDIALQSAVSAAPKNLKKTKKDNCSGGIVYPTDLWYLIGKYIHPEDVGRFAGTCQAARQVTQTSAFWRHLYKRYYSAIKEGLPEHVKPHSMEKLHGLRARVIRSMFYLYPPLVQHVQSKGPMEDEPHTLRGHRCLLAWHQPATKGWLFCFKFQKPSLQPISSKPDIYHGYNDPFYNPEGGCSVLQVTCCHFASVSAVMGLLLNQVYVTLSTGFRYHRLRLHFDSRITPSNYSSSDTVVVLDDVISIRRLQWWYPGYPFTS